MQKNLPLLPGYNFSDTDTFKDHRVKQKLKFRNGFRVINDDFIDNRCCCGSDDCTCNDKGIVYDPTLTYGRPKSHINQRGTSRFLPHYVLYDRKILRFDGYFKQSIIGSADESYRVHRIRIMYYLEDDTMAVLEKPIANAGFVQGKLVKRSRIPRTGCRKTTNGETSFYHWKDLNVAIYIEIYGVTYRLVSCDAYTREFLTSQGIDVNEPEQMPEDPYLRDRNQRERQLYHNQAKNDNKSRDDERFLFLEYDNGLVLSFDAVWEDNIYRLRYYLEDGTMAVSEVNGGKGKLMLKRTRVPKNWKDVPDDYSAAYMERTNEDVKEYYRPADLKVGGTVFVFGRRFFIYDCDSFTRRYYAESLRAEQSDRIDVPQAKSCEDNDFKIKTNNDEEKQLRREDALRKLYNFPRKLRYSLSMEAVRSEDEGREFVLEYRLSDGTIRIDELARRNSGRPAGVFVGPVRVPRSRDEGEYDRGHYYYTPEDFAIGARIKVFGHWFVITGTEPRVYKYMLDNPEKFSDELKRNVEEYLRSKGLIGATEMQRGRCTAVAEVKKEKEGECRCDEDHDEARIIKVKVEREDHEI